jgi:hypothetical protein
MTWARGTNFLQRRFGSGRGGSVDFHRFRGCESFWTICAYPEGHSFFERDRETGVARSRPLSTCIQLGIRRRGPKRCTQMNSLVLFQPRTIRISHDVFEPQTFSRSKEALKRKREAPAHVGEGL